DTRVSVSCGGGGPRGSRGQRRSPRGGPRSCPSTRRSSGSSRRATCPRWRSGTCFSASAADRAPRALRVHEVRVVHPVTRPLRPDPLTDQELEVVVGRARTHGLAEIRLLEREQEVAELYFPRPAHAVRGCERALV